MELKIMQEIDISNVINQIHNKKLLLAVSGGVDSMVMMELFAKLQKNNDFYMEIIHINHNLRGEESDQDACFVQKKAKQIRIPCKVVSVDVKKHKVDNKQTIEQAARELRLGAIEKYKNANKFDFVVFAHNGDDQAETVLMHICRGSGLKGAAGILNQEGVLRPLLKYSKKSIIKYAVENNIEYREDSTNSSIEYTRNYIRHEILPKLEEIYPNVKNNLIRFAEIANADNDYILSSIDMSKIICDKDMVSIHFSVFDEKESIYSRMVFSALNMLGVYSDIEQKHVLMIRDLSYMKNGAYICLPNGLFAYKEYEYVVFSHKKPKNMQNNCEKYKFGTVKLGNANINIIEVSSDDVVFGEKELFFDADSIPSDAVFRYRKVGDVFHKLNSGTKKFSDYLTDRKVPLKDRDHIVVLASKNRILLALGLDISDDIKITSSTSRIAKISYTNKD